MTTLYHFTAPGHLPTILEAGFLKLTESNVSPEYDHAGRDVVWLTTDPVVGRRHALNDPKFNRPGTLADKTRVRFTVDAPDAVPWLGSDECKAMDPRWRGIMVETGGGLKAARTWWMSYEPIPSDRWLDIQVDGVPHG